LSVLCLSSGLRTWKAVKINKPIGIAVLCETIMYGLGASQHSDTCFVKYKYTFNFFLYQNHFISL
jgi:hypothetical protein